MEKTTKKSLPRPSTKHQPSARQKPQNGLWCTDVNGPLTRSAGGKFYTMNMVHYNSGLLEIDFLFVKSDTLSSLTKLIPMVQARWGLPVTILRSDLGGEYTGASIKLLLTSLGVIQQFTAADSSGQNQTAERRWRLLREAVITMLAQSGLPNKFWADAMKTAAYVRNRIPSTTRNNLSAFEIVKRARPRLAHLQPFGCLCFSRLPDSRRIKRNLSPRTVKCVLLGYCEETKDAYKLLNVTTGRVMISRSVTFHPTTFPFREARNPSPSRAITYRPQLVYTPPQEEQQPILGDAVGAQAKPTALNHDAQPPVQQNAQSPAGDEFGQPSEQNSLPPPANAIGLPAAAPE
jgi:transposase InsO family protein